MFCSIHLFDSPEYLLEIFVREFLRQSRWSLSVLPSDNPCGFSVQCTRHGCTAASIRCEWWNRNRNRYSVSCKKVYEYRCLPWYAYGYLLQK
jgi:hypothetical protein